MSEFHTSSFSGASAALFSQQQIEALMRIEYERATRYEFPVLCLMIGVDRLTELQDLYGFESREEILSSIVDMLAGATRASDFLGCLVEDRILALLTHTPPEIGPTLARRVLARARQMRFDSGAGRSLRITLSIGTSHNQHAGLRTFDGMVETAVMALGAAQRQGGDRVVEREEIEDELRELEAELESRNLLLQEEQQAIVEEALAEAETRRESLAVRIDEVVDSTGLEGRGLEELRNEMFALARRQMEEERDRIIAEKLSEKQGEIERLERRLSKLTDSLGVTEAELQRLSKLKDVDLGLASIYREVQGLADGDSQAERKKEMMKTIFEANLGLRDSLKSHP